MVLTNSDDEEMYLDRTGGFVWLSHPGMNKAVSDPRPRYGQDLSRAEDEWEGKERGCGAGEGPEGGGAKGVVARQLIGLEPARMLSVCSQ